MTFKHSAVAAFLLVAGMVSSAQAYTVSFDVQAVEHSYGRGLGGLKTGLNFAAGELISGSVDPDDLWSAGNIPRWSNADGLITDLYATGSDESGAASGTKIGQAFGNLTLYGLSAPFGSLVGRINNSYFLLGTSFNLLAPEAGLLSLYYWDSDYFGNEDFVTVSLEAPASALPPASSVPLPATVWLLGSSLIGLLGFKRRQLLRKKHAA